MKKQAQGAIEYLLIIGAAILVVALVIIVLSGLLSDNKSILGELPTEEVNDPITKLLAETCVVGEEKCIGSTNAICVKSRWIKQAPIIGVCDAECDLIGEQICGNEFLQVGDPLGINKFSCSSDYNLVDLGPSLDCGAVCLAQETDSQPCGCNDSGTQTRYCEDSLGWSDWEDCENETLLCNSSDTICLDYRTKGTCMPGGCGYSPETMSGGICLYNGPTAGLIQKFSSGSGTLENPYIIGTYNTCNYIKNISFVPDKNFALLGNISIESSCTFNPIPTFSGTFNGNNFAINYLKLFNPVGNAGLFATANGAYIHDLNFTNVNITGGIQSNNIGTLAGSCTNCRIENVRVLSGSTLANPPSCNSNIYLGGIVGTMDSSSIILSSNTKLYLKGCVNVGGISGSSSGKIINSYADANINYGYFSTGGIVGVLNSGGLIENSYSKGLILGGSETFFVGGIAGKQNSNSIIINSYSDANVNYRFAALSSSYFGGLVGKTVSGDCTIKNSYFTGTLHTANYGGIVGSMNSNAGVITNTFTTSNKCNATGTAITCATGQSKNSFFDHTGTLHAVYYNTPNWDNNWIWAGSALPTLR